MFGDEGFDEGVLSDFDRFMIYIWNQLVYDIFVVVFNKKSRDDFSYLVMLIDERFNIIWVCYRIFQFL